MAAELTQYAEHFREGTRVSLGVPLDLGGVFQEWGVVRSLDEDLLELELSRDELPEHAALKAGDMIDLRLPEKDEVKHCRGMVAMEPELHRLLLRLVEEVELYEPRQFYRQDVYLPLTFRLPPRQSADEIRESWRGRLWAREFAGQEPDAGESEELRLLREELRRREEERKAVPPVAANLSGGGVRFNMAERLDPGMLVELSIPLPDTGRILELVGEVVQVRPLPDGVRFSTALSFRFVEEADRDRLIGFLSAQQLRQLKLQAPTRPSVEWDDGRRRRRTVASVLFVLFLTAFVGCQVRAIVVQRDRGEKHEIERLFEDAVAKFLRQRR